MSEVSEVPQRSRTWRWIRIGLLFVLVAFLAVWNLLPPGVVRNPLVLGRGDDGKMHEQSPEHDSGLNFNAHVGTLRSQNNTMTASSESHSNPAFFSDRSLVILNLSNHVLMERIGIELLELLKADNQFDRVEYYPAGHGPEIGAKAPDLFLCMNLESIEESGIASQTLKAIVSTTLGSSPAASSHFVQDHLHSGSRYGFKLMDAAS